MQSQVVIVFLLSQAPKYKNFLSTYLSLITTIITQHLDKYFWSSTDTRKKKSNCQILSLELQESSRFYMLYFSISSFFSILFIFW